MKARQSALESIDEYIASYPDDIQELLRKIRKTIRESAPDADEKISYQMPTFSLNGNLVHFAAWQKHIGFYPGASGIAAFKEELSMYEFAKGSVQFPYGKPIPFDLISKIVKFRVMENLKKAEVKKKRK